MTLSETTGAGLLDRVNFLFFFSFFLDRVNFQAPGKMVTNWMETN